MIFRPITPYYLVKLCKTVLYIKTSSEKLGDFVVLRKDLEYSQEFVFVGLRKTDKQRDCDSVRSKKVQNMWSDKQVKMIL